LNNDIAELEQWFNGELATAIPAHEMIERYHAMHPRCVFLKTLPAGAKVLDMGAGDGGFHVFRQWPAPARPDIRLYAYSLEKGAQFDEYDGFELGNWEDGPPDFGGMKFDAIHCAHFIEHIRNPAAFIRWAASRLAPEGRIYLEWPSEESRFTPTLSELAAIGFGRLIGNFYDDPTHRELPGLRLMVRQLRAHGLQIESAAPIVMPLFEDELLAHYRATSDPVSLQLAYWLKTRWCQFVTARATQPPPRLKRWCARCKIAIRRPPSAE
jgi:SAM-dependent methyltransferase